MASAPKKKFLDKVFKYGPLAIMAHLNGPKFEMIRNVCATQCRMQNQNFANDAILILTF